MKTPSGFACNLHEIEDDVPDGLEPDWTIYADCQGCGWFHRGEWGEDQEAMRFRVDNHIRTTGHTVKWADAEQEFYDRDPVMIGPLESKG